jgi:antimicrobial peptide system SdpB family protein
MLALATVTTLLCNPSAILFHARSGVGPAVCSGLAGHLSLFCIVPAARIPWVQILAGIALIAVATGWRPRYTAILHWWITYSVYNSVTLGDGGEQVADVITLLLVPLAISDPRRWHWGSPPSLPAGKAPILGLVGYAAFLLIQLQVAGIYLDACIEKLRVPEWTDGTVMYYVMNNNYFGPPAWLQPLLKPLVSSWMVVLLTWPSLMLEFSLGVNLLLRSRVRRVLFYFGAAFHVAIGLSIGIPTFGAIMVGVVMLGVVPIGDSLADLRPRLPSLARRVPATDSVH